MNLEQGVRNAARTLRRSPGWALGVILTLALGIGLATAVFAIADALLIRPLPVRDQSRLVVLWGNTRDGRTDHFPLLYRDALEYARRARTLDRVEFFAFGGAQALPLRVGNGILRLRRSLVSGGYFDLLGTRPLLGRTLRPQDNVQGATRVAVLSYEGWQRFFGGDSGVIGRRMTLYYNDAPYTIVGVMPLGLDYPQGVDFWAPVVPDSGPLDDQPIYAELNVIGRLRPGATITEARDELTRFFVTIGPRWNVHAVAHSFTDDVIGNVGTAVVAFATAAALLLLITCINVANLLLVRGLARMRELAVRSALGAGRGRLVAQLLTESGLLACAGGIAGALFAAAAVHGFVTLAPAGTPRLAEIHVTGPVLFGAIAVTALAMALFAIAPTLVTSRVDVQEVLRSSTRQSSGSRRFRLGTQALVVGQVALALLVLSAAGLVARSLMALERVDPTFDPSRLLVAELALPHVYMGDTRRTAALMEQLVTRLEAMPGVRSVAPTFTVPFAPVGGVFGPGLPAEGQSTDDAAKNPEVNYEVATPHYFRTLGIPLVRGRGFNDGDAKGTLPVIVISESVARYYWPGVDPIGKRLVRGGEPLTVVGVVGDTHYRDLRNPRPNIYVPLRQSPFPFVPVTLVVATGGQPIALAPEIRRAVSETALGVTVASAVPYDVFLGQTLAQPRLNALLLGLFASAAVVLAAVGLFGVMATAVRLRTHELGVRLALGATPELVRRALLGQALTLASIGVAIGFTGSLAGSRFLRSLLFAVSPSDPFSLGGACALLVVIAVAAAWRPAHRATRIDPAIALRAE